MPARGSPVSFLAQLLCLLLGHRCAQLAGLPVSAHCGGPGYRQCYTCDEACPRCGRPCRQVR